MTTSKGEKRYGVTANGPPCGCPSASCYRIDQGQEPCFDLPTWVQYDNIFAPTQSDLEEQRKAGKVEFIQMLSPDRVRSVMNCAVKSIDLEGRHIEQIKKTLGAMKVKASGTAQAPKLTQAKTPLDSVLEHLASHGQPCRRNFCELADISEVELADIMAESKVKPNKLDLEAATLAMQLVAESCTCNAPKRT